MERAPAIKQQQSVSYQPVPSVCVCITISVDDVTGKVYRTMYRSWVGKRTQVFSSTRSAHYTTMDNAVQEWGQN